MRQRITIASLAFELGDDPDTVCLRLMDAGLNVASSDVVLPKSCSARARRALGLPAQPEAQRSRDVSVLGVRFGVAEETIRTHLKANGLLPKKRLKKVPRHCLPRAEDFLETVARSMKPRAKRPHRRQTKRKQRVRKSWRTIGKIEDISYLAPSDAKQIHWILVNHFKGSRDPIDPPGVRDQGLLESCVYRQQTQFGGSVKYPTVAMAGASLLYGIVLDHAFHNGNKRTALVSLLAFLDRNDWVLNVPHSSMYDFLLMIADHTLTDRHGKPVQGSDGEVLRIADWLQRKIRRVQRGEYSLQYRDLRKVLNEFGCDFNNAKVGNRVNISRQGLQTQIAVRNEGTDVAKNTIHKIRRDLQLDPEHGFDGDVFYNSSPRIPKFIREYQNLLQRLAKV